MIIEIKDKYVELRYTMRALLLFENVMDKSLMTCMNNEDVKTIDVIVFFWCVILASGKKVQLTLEELIDMIDENPLLLSEFSDWLRAETIKQNMLTQNEHVEVNSDKKKLSI